MPKHNDFRFLWLAVLFILLDVPVTLGEVMHQGTLLPLYLDCLPDVIGAGVLCYVLGNTLTVFPQFSPLRKMSFGMIVLGVIILVTNFTTWRVVALWTNNLLTLWLCIVLYILFRQLGVYAREQHCVLQAQPNLKVLKFYAAAFSLGMVAAFVYPFMPRLGLLLNTLNMACIVCQVLLVIGAYATHKAWKEHVNTVEWTGEI